MSETLFTAGLILCGVTVAGAVAAIISINLWWKRISSELENEYGKKVE
jgi:hypothetical protein